VILEEPKEGEIGHNARHHRELFFARSSAGASNDFAPEKVRNGGEEHQTNEPGLPPTVEDITAQSDPDVTPAKWQVVIHQQKPRQEVEDEDVGGKNHDRQRKNLGEASAISRRNRYATAPNRVGEGAERALSYTKDDCFGVYK